MRLLAALALLTFALSSQGASKEVISAKIDGALVTFREKSPAGAELVDKAAGVLVFPDVVKMGFGIGGSYGEGALLIDGEPVAFYSSAGASFGLQMGAQFRAQMILFMTEQVLQDFRQSRGWEAGVDGTVAIATLGEGGSINTDTIQEPIVGFVFSSKGLMYNLTLEGFKITKIRR